MKDGKKKKDNSAIARKIIGILFFLSALALIVTGVRMYQKNQQSHALEREVKEQEEWYQQLEGPEEQDKLANAKAMNPQVIAWITIPDTPIDYPVMQCEDNEYYLTHNLVKEKSTLGVPFLDYRNSSDFSDFHSILYGHHITMDRMFTPLVHFTEQDYFDSHEQGLLMTDSGDYEIHFIACLVLKSDSFLYETVFLTEKEKEEFLNRIKAQAVKMRDFNGEDMKDRQMVSLSTCSYEFEDARTVLIGYLESRN